MVGRTKSQTAGPLRQDVRGQILKASTRLFAAHGFDGTSLQDVADAVGVRKPSLLHHFPSKEALRKAVLEQMLAHWTERLPRLLLATSAAEGRFEAVTEALVAFFQDDPDRARLMLREAMDRPKETRELLVRHVRTWTSAIADYIRRGQEHDEHFVEVDADAYVACIMQLVITTTAAEELLGALLTERKGAAPRGRIVREALRIAKTSLFIAPRAAARVSRSA
jgi:AcrR family transcriptional regulator